MPTRRSVLEATALTGLLIMVTGLLPVASRPHQPLGWLVATLLVGMGVFAIVRAALQLRAVGGRDEALAKGVPPLAIGIVVCAAALLLAGVGCAAFRLWESGLGMGFLVGMGVVAAAAVAYVARWARPRS